MTDTERDLENALNEIMRLDMLVSFYKEIARSHQLIADLNGDLRDAALDALAREQA